MPHKYQKSAFVKIGNICNNKCLGCVISAGDTNLTLPTEKIKGELLKIKKAGFDSVELIGGEITIQKNFWELFKFASSMFPEITLTTNGRMFAYEEFVKKIISYPAYKLNLEVAIQGHNALIHDSFTKTPDSFKEMMSGMKNIIKYRKYFNNLGINTLILKSNYKYLNKILSLILDFKSINTWYLLSFVPLEGRALDNTRILMPRYKDLLILNDVVSRAYNNFDSIYLKEFPYCVFGVDLFNNKRDKVFIINGDHIEVEENKKIINFNPTFSFNKVDYMSNISAYPKLKELKSLHVSLRTKLSVCKKCIYSPKCSGIWKEYLNLFGSDSVNKEIKYLNKINQPAP